MVRTFNKKTLCFILAVITLFVVSACGNQDGTAKKVNVIQPYELSKTEQDILTLSNQGKEMKFFEYHLDDTVNKIEVVVEGYAGDKLLEDWRNSYQLEDRQGRIGLGMEKLDHGLSWSWGIIGKSEESGKTAKSETVWEDEANPGNLSYSVSPLSEPFEFEPGREFVLAAYVFDRDGNMAVYVPEEYLEHPELLKENDYTYLVKCRFLTEGMPPDGMKRQK